MKATLIILFVSLLVAAALYLGGLAAGQVIDSYAGAERVEVVR